MCVANVPTTHVGATDADKQFGLLKAGGPMVAVKRGLSGDRSVYATLPANVYAKAGQIADTRANDRAVANATPQQGQQAQYAGKRSTAGGATGGSLLVPSATQGGLAANTTNPNKTLLGA